MIILKVGNFSYFISFLTNLCSGDTFCDFTELLIPCFSEASDEWFAEEPIDGQTEFCAFPSCRFTDIPSVVVESDGAIGELLGTDGVKGTADRFRETCLSCSACLFECAEAAVADGLTGVAVVQGAVIGEDTVFSVDDAGDEVTLFVGIGHALTVDDALCRGREVAPDSIETVLYLGYFVHGDRGAGIALNTALALAGREVTTEMLRQDVGGDKHIAYL